ncbi:uncharacterized protein LOC123292926 [Chrysoperla carnea]|uniref:uncharacterized protein LOC123292926 n=1 Tax=Chrysoperla carnea TaxID=189513 RepID=UPI001D063A2F|nr:uncharacterized protein LOC123292926 [Chrysoperla carnea]
MFNFQTLVYCPFIIFLITIGNFIYGLNSVSLHKRDQFFITESPNTNIEESRQKYTSDNKENEDFDYSDDYKDILFVNSQNITHNIFNLSEKINDIDTSDFETYEDPDLSEIRSRPEVLRKANATINVKTESTTDNVKVFNNSTPSSRDIYYDEKDTDYYLRNYPRKDYIATVTVPTVIGISAILAILYVLLHLPKCCFGLFYEPSYQTYFQKNEALAAKEELQQEFLEEE